MWPPGEKPEGRLITLRSGGWVLLLALVGVLFVIAQGVRTRTGRIGGGDVASYRFDLSNSIVSGIVPSGMPREGVPPLVETEPLELADLDDMTPRDRKKVALDSDPVLGVVVGDEARAYPLRILQVHEVVNDALGGVPIAVVYQPLCGAMTVFERVVGGEALTFASSGLMWNSGQLLYDRREEVGTESLWCVLQARAVSGPAAARGERLARRPATLTTLGEWREAHPSTTVLAPDRAFAPLYDRNMYGNYLVTKQLRFPVEPYPPPGQADPWSEVVLTETGELRPAEGHDGPFLARALRWAWYAAEAD